MNDDLIIYNKFKIKHPEWNDEQIWMAVSMDKQTDNVIEERGANINPYAEEVIEEIMHRAMEWLYDKMPYIFEKVKEIFTRLLSNIGDWIKQGLKYVFDNLSNFF